MMDNKTIDTIFEILDELRNEVASQKAQIAILNEKQNTTTQRLNTLEAEFKTSCQNIIQLMLTLQRQTADLDWIKKLKSQLHRGLIMLVITLLSSLASWVLFVFKLLAKKSGLE